jgi:hypothetical protein
MGLLFLNVFVFHMIVYSSLQGLSYGRRSFDLVKLTMVIYLIFNNFDLAMLFEGFVT